MKPKSGLGAVFFGDSPAIRNTSIMIVLFGLFLIYSNWMGVHIRVERERQQALDGAFNETTNLAKAFEEHTLRTIWSADQTALLLRHQYGVEGRSIDIPKFIREGLLIDQYSLLSVVDETGELVASSKVPFVPVNVWDREHFQIHKKNDSGQLFIGKALLGCSTGKWSIPMTRRINKPDGSFGGVTTVSIDPLYFSEFYKQVDLGKHSAIALIGRDGVIRVRESGHSSVEVGRDLSGSPFWAKMENADIGSFMTTSPIDGVKRFYSFRALPDYPFLVLVGMAEEEVYRELNDRVRGYYWITGMNTLVIALFIVLLLGALFRQKRIEDALKEARDDLEATVESRTQELHALNQELTAMNEEHLAMNRELLFFNEELENEIADRKRIEGILQTSKEELMRRNSELMAALNTIELAQKRLVQQEKLAGIGQLAAGVAHEINNPLGFVAGNVEMLEKYFAAFRTVLAEYRQLGSDPASLDKGVLKERLNKIVRAEIENDIDYIIDDLPELFGDTIKGLERMNKIVKGMRLFSRVDQLQVFEQYDLNDGIESTLLVAHNEIKYHATVKKILGDIPAVEAVGSEINQVLLNLVVNAAQAIQEKNAVDLGEIRVTTWQETEYVYCSVEDTGVGIAPDHLNSLFNPFFTTKPVGKGTGMGLSISYDIIVNRHNGELTVESTLGEGTKFTIKLPICHESSSQDKNSHG